MYVFGISNMVLIIKVKSMFLAGLFGLAIKHNHNKGMLFTFFN